MIDRLGTGGRSAPKVDVAHAVRARSTGASQIVDVREPDEWAQGHIPGTVHIPLGDLAKRQSGLDPARPVIAVCHSGRRSLIAAGELREGGFADATSLTGGMIAWREAGQPVERSP